MKALKLTGVAVLVLVLAFFAIGLFIPSFEYEHRLEVNAPVTHCWTVFTNLSNMEKWVVDLKSMEKLSGDDTELGSRYKLVLEQDGREIEVLEEITAIKENELIAFAFEADQMFSTIEVHFSQIENGTEIVATKMVDGNNLFWNSLLWLSKPKMMKYGNKIYGNLKQLIEETSTSEPQEMTVTQS